MILSNTHIHHHKTKALLPLLLAGLFCFLVFIPARSLAAVGVTLAWDEASGSDVAGYRLFMRSEGEAYDLQTPVWSGSENTCIVNGLEEGATYYFVARAVSPDDVESENSNEVRYDTAADGSSLDTDQDGMPDVWELQYGLNHLVDDAAQDLDGDGVSNLNEYVDGSDPSLSIAINLRPELTYPTNGQSDLSLLPTLLIESFGGFSDGAVHVRTEWQISKESDFSSLVFRLTTADMLEELDVPELILDENTSYYWRVRLYDDSNGRTEWSDSFQFETIVSATDDTDADGIPDSQAVLDYTDLDRDGVSDAAQNNIKVARSLVGDGRIGVKMVSGSGNVEAMEMILGDSVPERAEGETPQEMVAFRLGVDEGATIEVGIYFSENLPDTAGWYKYDLQNGWQDYSDYATFVPLAGKGTMVIVELQDGGVGDADGVVNGVIVDPSGPAVSLEENLPGVQAGSVEAVTGESGSGGGCFLAASDSDGVPYRLALILLLLCGVVLCGSRSAARD